MKRFEIHKKDSGWVVLAGRPSDWAEVRNLLLQVRAEGIENEALYFLAGKPVSLDELLSAAINYGDEQLQRKMETHKQVFYYTGVCGSNCTNSPKSFWVRK
jgi:hypothetical protein